MRVNTHISTKEKRRYALDHLGGVDFSSSPLTCSPTRSPDAVNWIGDHGINRKRHGWEQVMDRFVYGTEEPIEGIINISSKNRILIVTSLGLYSAVQDSGKWIVKKTLKVDEKEKEHPAIRVQAFFNKGKCYIVGAGDIICYNIEEDELEEIVPYIPTTTINIGHSASENDIQSTLDPVNLLTKWRKNTLVGVDELPNTDKEGTNWVGYYLDSASEEYTDITITAKVKIGDGLDDVEDIEISNSGTDKAQLYYSKDGKEYNCGNIVRSSKANGRAVLQFTEAFPPPIEDNANITVTFCAAVDDKSSLINGCTFGTLFGIGGRQDRLFLSGNKNYPNLAFFSEENDFAYFPDIYTATFGTDSEPITGMLKLSDDVLAVMKRNVIYYQSGEYYTVTDDSGNLKKMLPKFTITQGSISEGCLNPYSCANFGNDNVFLSSNGVYSIDPTSNVLTNTRVARERSYPIASRFPLNNALYSSCFTHGQRLYVSDGNGDCYVADSAYKYKPEGSEAYSYEWWYWDNIPAHVWAEVNGELWFGTSDGRVCRFTDGYMDSTYEKTAEGDLTFSTNGIIYNKADLNQKLKSGIRVRFEKPGWKDSDGNDLSSYDLYVRNLTEGTDENSYIQFTRYAVTDDEDPVDSIQIASVDTPKSQILNVYTDQPVVAEWTSPPLDFGSDSFSKTLFSITVTAETGKNSLLEFGYETRKKADSFLASGLGVFSFEDMDFAAFSFENGFQSSYTVRARDRDFNFLRFCLRSDGDKPCAVHRISALYKINKQNKGVV